MLKLKEFKTFKLLEIKNPRELKELLSFCNPLVLEFYKNQLNGIVEVREMGEKTEIIRL